MRRALALVVSVAALSGGCTGRGSTPSLRIGALYPRSGPQAAGGRDEARGVSLAAEWVNSHGGVRGKRVSLVAADAPRAESVPAVMRSLRGRGVSVVLGSYGSPISAAAAEAAGREDMTFWETGAVGQVTPEVAGGRNFFRLAPMGANLGRAAVAFVRDQLASKLPTHGPLRYAVANVDDAYGRAVAQGAIDEATGSGQVLAGTFPYDAHQADLHDVVTAIGAARPDVLFVAAYIDDGVALRRATLAAGIPLLAGIGTSSSYCMPVFGDRLGDQAVGLFASDKPDAAAVRPDDLLPEGRGALAWVRPRFERRYHEPMSAAALSGFAHASALLRHVLPAARSTLPGDMATAAQRVKLPIGSLADGGGLDLAGPGQSDAGENRRAASVIWEWVAPRTRAVVWPAAFATHPIVALPIDR